MGTHFRAHTSFRKHLAEKVFSICFNFRLANANEATLTQAQDSVTPTDPSIYHGRRSSGSILLVSLGERVRNTESLKALNLSVILLLGMVKIFEVYSNLNKI